MIKYSVGITVERPAVDVFPYLADIVHFPSWMGGTRTEPISDGPMRVGYRYRYLTGEGMFEMEVSGFDPDRRVTTRTVSGPFHWSGTFEVVADGGDRSRVVSRGEIQLRGLMRVAQPFMGGEIAKREQQELVRLKALVEGSAG